jgi:hypothetical protein
MKISLLAGGLLLASGLPLAQAGSVSLLGNAPEAHGTLSLNGTSIHVDGASPSEISLADVLEADFGETPFQLDYFSSATNPAQLPPGWQGTDLGHPSLAGSAAYAQGLLTLAGSGSDLQKAANEDQYYVFGQSLTGDRQLTARVQEVGGSTTQVGPTLRQDLGVLSPDFSIGIGPDGGGLFRYRYGPSGHEGWSNFASAKPPIFVRLVRRGLSVDGAISSDGKKWEIVNQLDLKTSAAWFLGFFVDTFSAKTEGKGIFDQIVLEPCAAEPETVPKGVLLRSGSFLAGSFQTTGPSTGNLDRNGKTISLNTDQIAAVVFHAVTRAQIAAQAEQPGLIMRNGDYLAADIQSINGSFVTLNSVLLGIVSYEGGVARACVLQPEQPQPSDYEIRLKDGSIVRAKSLSRNGDQIAIAEVSGLTWNVSSDEIAEIRAGLSRVQPLIDLPSKAAAAHNSVVERWAGPNQEQILAAPVGTALEFPLPGKFRAVALRIAVASGAAPGAQVTVRILAGGTEVFRAPPCKAGDQPLLVRANIPSPKAATIVADSDSPGAMALFIDPVAIR